nr:MAG: hypothetical protein [Narnaviridae sp.]
MVKSKKTVQKQSSRTVTVKRKKTKTPRSPRSSLAASYAQLLVDPCSGPINKGVYPGPQGVVQRFTSDFTMNGAAGLTCGVFAYFPKLNGYISNSLTSSGTAFTPSWTVAPNASPGHAFLIGVASRSRPHAACITAIPSALSVTNIQGEWAYGVVTSAELLSNGAATTIDAIFNILNTRSIIQRATLEVKWSPGLRDNQFATYGTLVDTDVSDDNVVVLAYRGVPAATTLGFRLTSVLEWTPKIGIGLSSDGAASAVGINHVAVAATLHKHKPNWFHSVLDNFAADATVAIRQVGRAGLYQGSKYLMEQMGSEMGPLMLSL